MNPTSPETHTAAQVCVIDNVTHTYQTAAGAVEVLKGIDATLHAGEVAAIVGPSGSGKSTLLSIMGLLLKPTSGRICIDGTEAGSMSTEERARFRADHISFIFQAFHLVEHLTVAENIRLARTYSNRPASSALTRASAPAGTHAAAPMPNTHTPTSRPADVDELIEMVGLSHRKDAFPSHLSGGEKQRCAIARALNSDARLLLCDEPTGNLDERNSARVMDIISQVAHTQGRAVGLITHDLTIAAQADAVYTINHGVLDVERTR